MSMLASQRIGEMLECKVCGEIIPAVPGAAPPPWTRPSTMPDAENRCSASGVHAGLCVAPTSDAHRASRKTGSVDISCGVERDLSLARSRLARAMYPNGLILEHNVIPPSPCRTCRRIVPGRRVDDYLLPNGVHLRCLPEPCGDLESSMAMLEALSTSPDVPERMCDGLPRRAYAL